MISLSFIKGRTNEERFVIKIHKPLSQSSVDFVRIDDHGVDSLSLVDGENTMSTQSGEIKTKTVDVRYSSKVYQATEFEVKPTAASLESLSPKNKMELLVNGDKRLCFVDVLVTE